VFLAQNCFRCHSIGDIGAPMAGGPPGMGGGPPMPGKLPGPGFPGGKMGSARGPDLAHVGKDPEHTVDWLMAHIRNPKTHKPDSRMPAFPESKINDEDLRHLAGYLASLK
jgi:mono/diheme cytochrome c family protein